MSRHNNSDILEYCRVIGCRFKGTHTWQDHICGTCGEKGHGQIECGNYTRQMILKIMEKMML